MTISIITSQAQQAYSDTLNWQTSIIYCKTAEYRFEPNQQHDLLWFELYLPEVETFTVQDVQARQEVRDNRVVGRMLTHCTEQQKGDFIFKEAFACDGWIPNFASSSWRNFVFKHASGGTYLDSYCRLGSLEDGSDASMAAGRRGRSKGHELKQSPVKSTNIHGNRRYVRM